MSEENIQEAFQAELETSNQPVVPEQSVDMPLFHKQCGKDGLPCIVLTSEMPLRTVTERALEILKERNKTEPFIFQRSGRLVTIRTVKRERAKDGKLVREKVIVAIDLDILRGMLRGVGVLLAPLVYSIY